MVKKLTELMLAKRAEELAQTLKQCEITGGGKEPLGLEPGLELIFQTLVHARKNGGSVYVIGNGGSAGVASHVVNDFVNVAKLRALTLHEPALLTCMTNDHGYENAFSRLLAVMVKSQDVLVAISSSGRSRNIHNAVAQAKDSGATVITLSGFDPNNSLRLMGDINIWLDSHDYGLVEIGHQFVLHNLSDRFLQCYDGQ